MFLPIFWGSESAVPRKHARSWVQPHWALVFPSPSLWVGVSSYFEPARPWSDVRWAVRCFCRVVLPHCHRIPASGLSTASTVRGSARKGGRHGQVQYLIRCRGKPRLTRSISKAACVTQTAEARAGPGAVTTSHDEFYRTEKQTTKKIRELTAGRRSAFRREGGALRAQHLWYALSEPPRCRRTREVCRRALTVILRSGRAA